MAVSVVSDENNTRARHELADPARKDSDGPSLHEDPHVLVCVIFFSRRWRLESRPLRPMVA